MEASGECFQEEGREVNDMVRDAADIDTGHQDGFTALMSQNLLSHEGTPSPAFIFTQLYFN